MVSSKMYIRGFSPFQYRLAWAPWWHPRLTKGYINQLKDPHGFLFFFRRVECRVLPACFIWTLFFQIKDFVHGFNMLCLRSTRLRPSYEVIDPLLSDYCGLRKISLPFAIYSCLILSQKRFPLFVMTDKTLRLSRRVSASLFAKYLRIWLSCLSKFINYEPWSEICFYPANVRFNKLGAPSLEYIINLML